MAGEALILRLVIAGHTIPVTAARAQGLWTLVAVGRTATVTKVHRDLVKATDALRAEVAQRIAAVAARRG